MFDDATTLWAQTRFRRLFLARFISNVGNGITPVALAFGVLGLKGSTGSSLSLVAASQMIPGTVLLLVGGTLADRHGRARIVGGSDMVLAGVVGLTGVLFLTNSASVALLCVAAFVIGSLNAMWYPAFAGLMPEIVERRHLQSANALAGFASNVGFAVGAGAAGVLVSTLGVGWAILADALSFLVAGSLVVGLGRRVVDGPSAPPIRDRARPAGVLSLMRQGWEEFRSRTWLVAIVAGYAVYNMCFEGFLAVLAPLQMDQRHSGASSMGLMMFAWGAGSVLGVFVSLRVRPTRPLVTAVAASCVMCLWIAATSFAGMWVIVPLAFAAGICLDVFVVLWMTTFQSRVPADALSRVGSFDAFGSNVLVPVGLLAAGPIADAASPSIALLSAGLLGLVALVATLGVRDVRQLRTLAPAAT